MKVKSAFGQFLEGFFSQGKAVFGLAVVVTFVILALLAPVLAPGDPTAFVDDPSLAPSMHHLLGTNAQGQDMFSQLIWGAQSSLFIGFTVGFLITVIGLAVGMTAGYLGGFADGALNAFTNVFLIIPALPLLITIASFLPPGIYTVMFVLVITSWAWPARVFRSQTLTLREKDFVFASVVAGERTPKILFVEILPNMLSLVVASFFGNVIYAIGADVGLAFLGFEDLNKVSWGTMLYWAQNNSALLTGSWWTFAPAGLCVALVAFGTTMMIYAIDEITNPRLRSEKEISRVLKKFHITAQRSTPVVRS